MNRFELNFENKRVRIWFLTVLPTIILAALFYIFLPMNFYFIPTFLLIIAIIIYVGWLFIDKKKQKNNNNFFS